MYAVFRKQVPCTSGRVEWDIFFTETLHKVQNFREKEKYHTQVVGAADAVPFPVGGGRSCPSTAALPR